MTTADADVAWLLFGELKSRPSQHGGSRPQHGFQNEMPAGVRALNDALGRADIRPTVVSPAAPRARVILVSLLSEQAAFQFHLACSANPLWRAPRKFTVLVGGFGMQNPWPVRHLADWAFFGRAEDQIADIVTALLHGRTPESDSLIDLRDIPRRPGAVRVRQAYELLDGETFAESFIGCPLKCKFCHYTFARRHVGGDHAYATKPTRGDSAMQYVQTDGYSPKRGENRSSTEVTLPQLIRWNLKRLPAQVTAGLDGPSERLRFLFGKRILDAELQAAIRNHTRLIAAQRWRGGFLHLLDILGMPTETTADREQMHAAIRGADPDTTGLECYFVIIRTVPFKASPWTPLQWEAYHTRDDRARLAGRRICRFRGDRVTRGPRGLKSTMLATYSLHIEGPGSQIVYALMSRHDGSAECDRALNYISAPRFRRARAARQVADFRRDFGTTATRLLDALPLDADPPSSVAEAGVPLETLRRMAAKSRDDAAAGRWRGKKSIMGATVAAAA